ncbi:hypothetical protein HED60_19310 [Planctomycetales bacterium ZRK34]|nr:hypothetical protein HED60_19310 [Planctomycetales bacterium ZRK34]
MANEITITQLKFSVAKGDIALDKTISNQQIDMSGDAFVWQVQNVGTSHEALSVPSEIATAGYAFFRNLDDTNFVEIGIDDTATFESVIKLKPSEFALLRLSTTAPYAKADTAAVNLEYLIVED